MTHHARLAAFILGVFVAALVVGHLLPEMMAFLPVFGALATVVAFDWIEEGRE